MSGSLARLFSRSRLSAFHFGAALALTAIASTASHAQQYSFTNIDDPASAGTNYGTFAVGISGETVVGAYYAPDHNVHGYTYAVSTSSFSAETISNPSASSVAGYGTALHGVQDNTILGVYVNSSNMVHGFTYDPTTSSFSSPINDPLASNTAFASSKMRDHGGTETLGISGTFIVGDYVDNTGSANGFIYNTATSSFTTTNDPLASASQGGTSLRGISGSNIVGNYVDSSDNVHSFLLNGSTFTPVADPLGTNGTFAFGISGTNVAGYYYDSSNVEHGFLYNTITSTFTTIDDPAADGENTEVLGIDGTSVVGDYVDPSGKMHGFIAIQATPEPNSPVLLSVLGLAGVGLLTRRRRMLRRE